MFAAILPLHACNSPSLLNSFAISTKVLFAKRLSDVHLLQEWGEPVKVPISERNAVSNNAKAVYEFAWDCNMDLTRRGVRGEVSVDIVIQDFGCVTLPILAKVYKHEDTSAAHGKLAFTCV